MNEGKLEVYLPGLCIKPLFLFCVSFSELHQSSTLRFLLVTFCIYWIHSSFSASASSLRLLHNINSYYSNVKHTKIDWSINIMKLLLLLYM